MILVTGATGNVGGELVRALLAQGDEVRALTRNGIAAPPGGAEAVAGDLNRPESLTAALAGVSAVFLLAGYADMAGVLAAVRRAGAQRVVLLSSGCVVGGDMGNAVVRYNVESEEAVRRSGVAWTILRPSGFMSNALRWLPQLHAGDVVRAPFPAVPVAAIDPFDIAAVAAQALTSSGHEGRSHRLTGPEALLPADQVRVLSAVLGRDLRFEGQSNEEAWAEMSAAMPIEYVQAFFSFFVEGTYDDSKVTTTVEELTGRAPRAFAQWAAAHADAFRT